MSQVPWGRYAEAYKAIHDKIDELLSKLVLEGTPTRINLTAGAEIVAAPGTGKKLRLCGFFFSVDADETVQLRWNGATGAIIVELPTKGVIGANLIGIKEESGENQNLYLTKSGSGHARGTVWTKEV